MFSIFLLLPFLIKLSKSEKKPTFVFELFRHGARGPITLDSESKDTFGEKWNSPEQLTSVGRRMHYILGYRNHERYVEQLNFLSKTFNPHEIYIISSDINRTIESALCQLQGLYPPNDDYAIKLNENQLKFADPPIQNKSDKINNEIKKLNDIYAPLPYFISTGPLHIFHELERRFNVYDSFDCYNTVRPIKEKNLDIQEIKDIENEFNLKYTNSFNLFLKQIGNYSFPNIVTICDQFTSDYIDGRNLSYLSDYKLNILEFNEFCGRVADVDFIYYLYGDKNREVNRISVSPMLSEMLVYLKKRVNSELNKEDIDSNLNIFSNPKFIMISGHDSTISGVEVFMNFTFNSIKKYIRPTFASSLFFEVYSKDNASSINDYEVHYIINDEELAVFQLNEFIDKIEGNLWNKEQISDFCKFNSSDNDSKTIWIIVLSIISGILLICVIVLFVRLKKKQDLRITKLIES